MTQTMDSRLMLPGMTDKENDEILRVAQDNHVGVLLGMTHKPLSVRKWCPLKNRRRLPRMVSHLALLQTVVRTVPSTSLRTGLTTGYPF